MTRLIVYGFAGIIEIVLWIFLVAGTYATYSFIPDEFFQYAVYSFTQNGNLQHELYQLRNVLKLAIGFFGILFLEIIFFGPVLLLWDIHRLARSLCETTKIIQSKLA